MAAAGRTATPVAGGIEEQHTSQVAATAREHKSEATATEQIVSRFGKELAPSIWFAEEQIERRTDL